MDAPIAIGLLAWSATPAHHAHHRLHPGAGADRQSAAAAGAGVRLAACARLGPLTDKLPHATVIWLVESYLGPVGVDDILVIVRTRLPAIGEIDYVMIVGELQLLQLSAKLVRLGKEEIDRALVTL